MSRPRLTLCIIARDEQDMLPDCLASVQGVVDRIVLVDTGSSDATREIAMRFGARIIDAPWRDDFAAARNAGLAAVRSGYVLILDADERLGAGAGRVLRKALRRGDVDLGFLPLHDAESLDATPAQILSGAKRRGEPQWLPRLLRYTPDLAYEGCVHESVAAWAHDKRARHLDAPIVHYGAVPEVRRARGKAERNVRLLEARAVREPDHPTVRAHLARELERVGQRDAALRESRAGWAALCAARDAGDATQDVLLPVTVHAQLLLSARCEPEAEGVLARGRMWIPEHPNLLFLAGVCAEQRALDSEQASALLADAAGCYSACLSSDPTSSLGEVIPGATSWQARLRLASVSLRRGDPQAARDGFAAVLADRPDDTEAQLGHAEARLDLGEAEAAMAELEPLLAEDEVDAWTLAAEGALRMGSLADARLFAERASAVEGQRGYRAPHRRARFAALASELTADPATKLAEAQPQAAPGAGPRSVLVLGSGRSGTSMLTGCLAEAGWYVGDDPYPARDSNPKGFFETFEINGINEALLAGALPSSEVGGAWQRWLATPSAPLAPVMPEMLAARVRALAEHAPFAFKDPRFAHTLPAWRPLLGADTGTLCIFRAPAVTAQSILQECASQEYLANVAMDFERALEVWQATYRAILERSREGGDWLFLHYDQLLENSGQQRLEEFVRAPIAREFPERNVSRTRCESPVPPEVRETYAELCALAGFELDPASVAVTSPPALLRDAARAPELSVIVCSYQRRDTLERCLDAFEAQAPGTAAYELIVVNDGSSDGTRELLEQRAFRVPRKIVHQDNAGLAAARNRGLAQASGRYVLFVNDDTIAHPGLVQAHLDAHAAHADAPIAVLGSFEQPAHALSNALMRHLEKSDLVFCYGRMQAGQTYDWTRFWTCNISVARDAVAAIDGFDESFRHYGCEDTDLGYRLWQRGIAVYYEPGARADHEHVLDLDALERRSHSVARAWARFFHKHPEALGHDDWCWVAALSRAACERYAIDQLPQAPVWRAAVAELASVDVGWLERASGAGAVAPVLHALGQPLKALNQLWWHEGLAEGLAELGVDSFAAISGREVSERRRLLVWPSYAEHGELDQLLREYGKHLAGRPDVQLFVVHDADVDGDADAAIAQLERAYATHIPDGAPLDVVFWTDPVTDGVVDALCEDTTCSIELPQSNGGRRRALLDRLSVPCVRNPDELVALVGTGAA